MSTSLQKIFSNTKEINFLGAGYKDKISYKNKQIEKIFEIGIKFARNDYFYKYLNTYKKQLDRVLTQDKLNVISNEQLILNFTLQGVDPEEKLKRLSQLLKNHDVTILLVTRNKNSLLKSLYNEFVKMGYFHSYNFFYKIVTLFKDRTFYNDLNYKSKILLLKKYFSKIKIFKFEILRNKKNLNSMLEGKECLYMHISSITYRNVYFQKEKFIAPLKKYAKISGDTALLFLMLNFDTTKEIFCMKKIVSQYNYTKKGKWSKMCLSQQKIFNFFNFLNYIKLVSFKYKILIILKKFRIIS